MFFLMNSFLTLHTKEKLFFEKGRIARGPSFKKNWLVDKSFNSCLTYPVKAISL